MNTFIRFFYEFISIFFDGLFAAVKGFIEGVAAMFNFADYGKIINNYKDSFSGNERIFVILSVVVLVIIHQLVIMMVQLKMLKM